MGSMCPPGKSGLSFDMILSRLQGKLQKIRETGMKLNSLNGAMNEIYNTLGGTPVCLQYLVPILHPFIVGTYSPPPSACP